eukprot:gene7061-6697_t
MTRLRDAVDGVLDEAGFTAWGAAREGKDLANIVAYAQDLQQLQNSMEVLSSATVPPTACMPPCKQLTHGKAYLPINECGAAGPPTDPGLREWAVACYLLAKGNASAMFLSGVQQYGTLMPPWPELTVPIGTPTSPAVPPAGQGGAWRRDHTNGTVLVNAQPSASATVQLDPARCYAHPNSTRLSGHSVTLPNATAAILTFTSCAPAPSPVVPWSTCGAACRASGAIQALQVGPATALPPVTPSVACPLLHLGVPPPGTLSEVVTNTWERTASTYPVHLEFSGSMDDMGW